MARAGPLAVVAVLALAVAACGGDREAPRPRAGGTAVVAVSSSPSTIFPPLVRTALDGEIASALFLGLNEPRWTERGVEYLQDPSLALADRRTFSPDGTSLTFHLDPRHRWSDGRSVTAGDVAFTYRLLMDADRALPLSGVVSELDSVAVHGDTAVTFHFRRRYPKALFDTGIGVLPAHAVDSLTGARRLGPRLRTTATGGGLPFSGPFRLAEWIPNDRIVLVRNGGNPATASRLDTVIFRVLPDPVTRAAELRSGGVHLAEIGSFSMAAELRERADVHLERVPKRAYDYLAWNPSAHPAFRDRSVRRALSLAIDRRRVLATLGMDPFAVPAAGPYGPLFPELAPPSELARHDATEARRLLDAAGWRLAAGADVRRRDDRELAFTLLVPAGSQRRRDAAQVIQGQLAGFGVAVELRTQEFNSLFTRVREGDYEAAIMGWQVSLDPDIGVFWYDAASPLNVVGYEEPEVRRLIDSARAAPTRDAAAPYWRRAGRRVAEDYPYAFLWYFDLLYGARDRLRGVDASPLGFAHRVHAWRLAPRSRP